ncbi:isochorismate synthase [Capnocytophaga catalasegens]|uniref:isochorismate synthase n=1 Tax=Capnocytophaga catalasegens TaxID=1004260 RepID=A0AAV5AUP1_9FLAO|nr:isochorismate synthase [Capnocytophaga catalasegens]GIZ16085.1 hypothetical protein RCZ03_20850 [Capnocytophaga catalasegens]GJM50244.1 hypothetical protein RCZ15_12170 [Capnocytophaga catalasegens]GJM53475.1 hypothetical protein RCZ16_17910 [Capnocytophaga catalasegens]
MVINYSDFLHKIQAIENEQLPFVVYKLPYQKEVHLLYQQTDELLETDFSKSGFVLYPFYGDSSVWLHADNHYVSVNNVVENGIHLGHCSEVLSGKQAHLDRINKAIKQMQSEVLQKVVLSHREAILTDEKPAVTYFERLITCYPLAFCYVFHHPKMGKWIAATPEILFQTEGTQLKTMSLAGTKPYIEGELPSWSSKEYEEQQIVTDTILSNLAPLTKNITISSVKTIRAGNLWHLCTDIYAEIIEKNALKDILFSLHPTPAVCGYPTEIARKFILENENYDRAFYTGFCGVINMYKPEKMTIYVNLRCAQILKNKTFVYVGGGITQQSNPEQEWEELLNKAQTMFRIVCQ